MEILRLKKQDVLNLLPERDPDGYKGTYGKILMLCGSTGYTGAAYFATMGALRCGAGLVILGVPDKIYPILASKLSEPIVFPLPDDRGRLSVRSIRRLKKYIDSADVVLMGPGLGTTRGVLRVVTHLLRNFNGTIVLDADGINVISRHMNILRERTAPTILTPHVGEFLRMGGNLEVGRVAAAEQLAIQYGVIVLLKGHETVITDGTNTYLNTTGNPGMAVGGSGDVLSGMISGFLGQGLSPLEAAACGAWIHGAAGDICANEIGQYGMLPTDMLHVLPRLMK